MVNITAGILTGGKSSRMGRDKALLPYGERTFLDHLAGELADFAQVLVSVDDPARWPDLPYPTVVDELSGFGPVEGIYQLLRRAQTPYLLVVATDMQYLTAAFLHDFAACLRPEDRCLVLRDGELLEPLCSVYHKDALSVLEQMRREGVRRPRALFSALPTRYVELSALGYGPEIVSNINTRAEYAALLEQDKEQERNR